MPRRLLAVIALVAGWLVGLALYRRAATTRRERVDLYFEDGSMLSVGDGTPEAERLLPLARDALGAARSG
jgi:hypothetical protein